MHGSCEWIEYEKNKHALFFLLGSSIFSSVYCCNSSSHRQESRALSQHMLLHEISNFPFVAFQLKIIISCSSYLQCMGATTSALTVIDISQRMDNRSLNFKCRTRCFLKSCIWIHLKFESQTSTRKKEISLIEIGLMSCHWISYTHESTSSLSLFTDSSAINPSRSTRPESRQRHDSVNNKLALHSIVATLHHTQWILMWNVARPRKRPQCARTSRSMAHTIQHRVPVPVRSVHAAAMTCKASCHPVLVHRNSISKAMCNCPEQLVKTQRLWIRATVAWAIIG